MQEKKEIERTCCFFGHRKILYTEALEQKLQEVIEELIAVYQVEVFLFGSQSEFNDLCRSVVQRVKEKYPNLRRIYVRAEFPRISDSYKKHLLTSYEETYFPPHIVRAGKAVYAERNCEMIQNSRFCVIYYDESFLPEKRKQRGRTSSRSASGTRLAYTYAVQKKRTIINLFDM